MTREQMLRLIDFFPGVPAWAKLVRDWENAQVNDALFVQEAGKMLGMDKAEVIALHNAITGGVI